MYWDSRPSWHLISTISGGDATGMVTSETDRFEIRGEKFRLIWTATPSSSAVAEGLGAGIYIHVYSLDHKLVEEIEIPSGIMKASTITTDIQGGPGYFRLTVATIQVTSYHLKVESYHSLPPPRDPHDDYIKTEHIG